MIDPWTTLDAKIEKAAKIKRRRTLSLYIQIMGVLGLFVLQFVCIYYLKVDPVIMAWYPAVFLVWGSVFVFISLRYSKQIQKIFEED